MSVSSEIERIQGAKADIKAAIEAKGVTVGAGLIDTYAAKVAQISGGGGNYNSYTASNTDDMQEISTAKKDDLCVIVNNTRERITEETNEHITDIHIEPMVILPDEVAENLPENLTIYFRADDEDPDNSIEFYFSDNYLSVAVNTSDYTDIYFDFMCTDDHKTWIAGGCNLPDDSYFKPIDIHFEHAVSFDSETSGAADATAWNDLVGYFIQIGKPEYYSTFIAEPRNEQIDVDDNMTDGIRYLVFYDGIYLDDQVVGTKTGGLCSLDESTELEFTLSPTQFIAKLQDADTKEVFKTITYTSNNGSSYIADDYGVLDFGEDPSKWMVWNDSAGLYDPLFIPFLRSIDQTVEWNEIIVEEAEPVS